jgi:hypothetical protein
LVRKVRRVCRGFRGAMDPPVMTGWMAKRDRLGLQGKPAPQDQPGLPVRKALRGAMVMMVKMGRAVLRVPRVRRAQPGRRDRRALRAFPALRG